MAPHSSTLAWKIPWMEEPGGLQSMGSLRVGYDWVTSFTFHFHALEKEMATHSSVLAWRIPGMGEPGRLQSMGSLRVGYDWETSLSLFTFIHWRREWRPTPVFLPGESQGWGASWAAVYGVTQSQTRLKRLSSSSSSMAVLFPVFQGIFTLFSIVDVSVYIPTSSVRRLSFLHTLSSIYCL